MQNMTDARALYVQEPFDLHVVGTSLTEADRIRVVDSAVSCGGAGAAAHTAALRSASRQAPAVLDAAGVPASGGDTRLAWSGLSIDAPGTFHVCWCSGVRSSDAGTVQTSIAFDTGNGSNDTNASGNASGVASEVSVGLGPGTGNVTPFGVQGCSGNASFDVDLGGLVVAGPANVTVLDEESGTVGVRKDKYFGLTVRGAGLGSGGQRIRLVLSPVQCGGPGAGNNTRFLRGALADDPDLPGRGADLQSAQAWGPVRLVRGGNFAVCWCSARAGGCDTDEEFNLQLGNFIVSAPSLGVFDEVGDPLRALPNTSFAITLNGLMFSRGDRIRVVELETACGGSGARLHTAVLRGPLAREPDLAGVLGSAAGGSYTLRWTGLKLLSGGVRRVCWCPGIQRGSGTGASVGCSRDSDFFIDVGTFQTLQVRHAWADPCARSRRPFRIHVAAVGLKPDVDRVLLAHLAGTCGEELPRGLSPGGQVAAEFGFAALRCAEDPNAGAALGERKMVCGTREGTILVPAPGTYRICLCGATPAYDCSRAEHYWVQAGVPFEVAGPAQTGSGADESAVLGSGTPPPMVLSGPSAALTLAYAPSPVGARRLLAAGSEDGMIRLWEPGTPRLVAELVGHTARVDALAWAPDGAWLVSGGADGTVRVWRVTAWAAPDGSTAHVCPQWAPVWHRVRHELDDVRWRDLLFGRSSQAHYLPGGDASDQRWQDAILGHIVGLLPGNVSEEPRAYLQGAPIADDLADKGELTLRRAARQCEKACGVFREMASPNCECGPTLECHVLRNCVPKCGLEAHIWQPAHELRITALAVSPDGALIASASMDGTVRLWNAKALAPEPLAVLRGHLLAVLTVAFSQPGPHGGLGGGVVLASGGDDARIRWANVTVVLANASAPHLVHSFDNSMGTGEAVLCVAFSADGRWFAAASSSGGTLWDVATRVKIRDLDAMLPGEATRSAVAIAGIGFADNSSWLALRGPYAVQLWPLSETLGEPPSGEWVSFSGDELGKALFSWTLRPGPEDNTPQYAVRRADNGTVLELHFTPCNISYARANTSSCSEHLPVVQLDVEVPFEFTRVRGSFVEFSVGSNLADDCAGGKQHSYWDDINASTAYWALLATLKSAEGADCERVGPQGDAGRASLEACKHECLGMGIVCNLLNWRQNPPSCDLRRCFDVTQAVLGPNPDNQVWAVVRRVEAEELMKAPHEGYAMFGAPSNLGLGGVLYGGCGAGPHVPASGVTIPVAEQSVPRTRRLRWQVAQSRRSETLAIRQLSLQLWRPVTERRFLMEPATSAAVAFAPARFELAAAAGDPGGLVVWDLRGFNFPTAQSVQYKLKSMFGFGISAPNLQDSDRVRIVSATNVPACGAAQSAINTRAVQGMGQGIRAAGNASYSFWDGIAVVLPGPYRVCFCGSRAGTCCDADADFATQLQTFVSAGADSSHYAVCEGTDAATRTCQILGFEGIGLQAGDMIMVQDVTNCGEATGPIAGLPNNGVMVSRATQVRDFAGEYSGGRFYRFESEVPTVPGVFDPEPLTPGNGLTARLCWCAVLSQCDPARPSDFKIFAGLLTIVRIKEAMDTTCFIRATCTLTLTLALATPVTEGDRVMVKTGTEPSQRLSCPGAPVAGLGADGDGLSSRLTTTAEGRGSLGLGLVSAAEGEYRVCWCQGSIRPCMSPEEFSFDIGKLTVKAALYVWPACASQQMTFQTWRQWQSFDDCCCNHAEAGALGCLSETTATYATCSKLPAR